MDSFLDGAIEILKGKLYLLAADDFKPPVNHAKHIFFSTDATLVYTAFFADFGPLDLGLTYTFCQELHEHLKVASAAKKSVVYYCADHPHRKSNSAVLLLAYMIFALNFTVEEAYAPFYGIEPPFTPFRDAAFCTNTYPLTILDCARAMRKVVTLGHFSYKDFSLTNFQRMSKLEHGDLSWIIPGKFLAFSGPLTKKRQLRPGVYTLAPEEYVPIFRNLGVTCIVRFNSKCYDRNVYLSAGIRHVDLYYEDGANPPEPILQAFLQLCENERGAIAVHCKAGLGRTGTNIAAYMIKHYGYTAKETIAWCRICRPGSVVGPQQQYLASIEERMKQEGDIYRQRHRRPGTTGASAPGAGASESAAAVGNGRVGGPGGLSNGGVISGSGMRERRSSQDGGDAARNVSKLVDIGSKQGESRTDNGTVGLFRKNPSIRDNSETVGNEGARPSTTAGILSNVPSRAPSAAATRGYASLRDSRDRDSARGARKQSAGGSNSNANTGGIMISSQSGANISRAAADYSSGIADAAVGGSRPHTSGQPGYRAHSVGGAGTGSSGTAFSSTAPTRMLLPVASSTEPHQGRPTRSAVGSGAAGAQYASGASNAGAVAAGGAVANGSKLPSSMSASYNSLSQLVNRDPNLDRERGNLRSSGGYSGSTSGQGSPSRGGGRPSSSLATAKRR